MEQQQQKHTRKGNAQEDQTKAKPTSPCKYAKSSFYKFSTCSESDPFIAFEFGIGKTTLIAHLQAQAYTLQTAKIANKTNRNKNCLCLTEK